VYLSEGDNQERLVGLVDAGESDEESGADVETGHGEDGDGVDES